MGTLNITFHGVCIHFKNTVPGVPHRVVLPDASAFQVGLVDVPGSTDLSYFLMPHFAILRLPDNVEEQSLLAIPGVMENGNIFDGVRLSVVNATDTSIDYDPTTYPDVPRIASYVSNYQYSDEVVVGGRAACYFDVFGGQFSSFQSENGGYVVKLTVSTNGAPQILATPILVATDEPVAQTLTLSGEPVNLIVANQGLNCESNDSSFDFMLHYLTAKGGIPRTFTKNPLGFSAPSTQEQYDSAVDTLRTLNYPEVFDSSCLNGVGLTDLSPACSDTQYP